MLKQEILENQKEILDIVRNNWDYGLKAEGDIIGTYRNAEYALFKQHINPLAKGNVDLTLTRSLRDKLKIFPFPQSRFTIFSTDEKAVKLGEKYGIDIYGISEEEEYLVIFEALLRVNKRLFEYARL